MSAGIADQVWAWLGLSGIWSLGAIAIVIAFRNLLKHTVGLWGVRTEADSRFEYRFAIQNLESVPIDEPVEIILEEPALEQEMERHRSSQQLTDLRIYSGAATPTFWFVRTERSDAARGSRFESRVTFSSMPAHDTWTIKLKSAAERVCLRIRPLGGPTESRPVLTPWIALTLSTSSVLVDSDRPVNSIPKFVPAGPTVMALCAIGPLLYLSVILPLLKQFGSTFSWPLDLGLSVVLGASGLLWYWWIRRPVYPTIQGYVTSRSPGLVEPAAPPSARERSRAGP